jgi:hypothetical protein
MEDAGLGDHVVKRNGHKVALRQTRQAKTLVLSGINKRLAALFLKFKCSEADQKLPKNLEKSWEGAVDLLGLFLASLFPADPVQRHPLFARGQRRTSGSFSPINPKTLYKL